MRTDSIVGRIAPQLTAVLGPLTPLVYAGGTSATDDIPAYVRAASAVRRFGGRLLVVQDDANVLALVQSPDGAAEAILLPVGRDGRRVFDDRIGNKSLKLDLEACAALGDGRLVIFGSGSKAARETVVVLGHDKGLVSIHAPELYAALRDVPGFAGSELNIEGVLVVRDDLLLLQRGNGAPRGGRRPVNAIGAIPLAAFLAWLDGEGAVPRLHAVTQLDFGTVDGCALGVTDAALTDDGRIAMIACAERSSDAVSDGPVVGCRFALLDGREMVMTDVLDETGRRSTVKLEGIEPRPLARAQFDVVADMDRHDEPAQIGHLLVTDMM